MVVKYKIKVINGPNINLLGNRETSIYGKITLATINNELQKMANDSQVHIGFFQSNHEGAIIDCIQESASYDGFIINPAAYTHTSIAIRDAFLAIKKPFVEVHLSDFKSRETFRNTSYLSDIAVAVISGKGDKSYYQGFEKLLKHLNNKL
jgi:3-dehydroquinate dehydratase II